MMNGTEKQIEWAISIKANMTLNLLGWLSQPGMGKHADRINAVVSKINTINDATWFIEHKSATNKEIIVAVESIA